MEILLYIGILALVLLSGVVIYFVSMMPNQKSFDEVKEEQKKKNDAEKKAALLEARERAMKAKEKKRQKKAAAKEDKRLNSLSAESDGTVEDLAPAAPNKEDHFSKGSAPKAQKQPAVSNKKPPSETKPVPQVVEKPQSKPEEKKPSAKAKGNVEATNLKENNTDKAKPEPKKKKLEVQGSSENNQNVQNVHKQAPAKEAVDSGKLAVSTEPPKEQRGKRDTAAKKAPEEPVVKKEQKTVDAKPTKAPVQQKAPVVEPPVVKEEVKVIAAVPKETKKQVSSVTSSPASAKGSKKKKSDLSTILALGNDKDSLDMNVLVPLVVKAELSHTEIETIIEVLLNKQTSGTTDWSEGRQDPLIKLRKQLEEKEKLLTSEKEISKGIQAKLSDLRSELNAEKHKTRHLEETVSVRTQELSGFAMQIKQISNEKTHQLQQLQSKLNEEHLMLCQLQEKAMKDECTQATLQQDLLQQIQSRDVLIGRLNETLAGMEAQMAQMAAQLQEQEAITGGISEEVNAEREQGTLLRDRLLFQENEIAALGAFKTELEHRLGQAQFELNRFQAENKTLTDQLNASKEEQEKKVKTLQLEISSLQESNQSLHTQISTEAVKAQQLKDENESLTAQVTANTERPAAEGRETNEDETSNSNGDKESSEEITNKYQAQLTEKEATITSLNKDLSKTQAELKVKKEEVAKLSKDIKQQESLVLSLRSEANTAKSEEVAKLSKDVKQQESLVSSLRSEVNTAKTASQELSAQVDSQRKKNDELRSKNYSIMEALSKTEKSLETKIKQSQESLELARTEAESAARALLARLFPQCAPKAKDTAHKAWIDQFESSLQQWIKEKSSSPNHSNSSRNGESNGENNPVMLSELEKQNAQLQAMVTNYKSIITDTEGMLNKLQTRVESEETRWNAQLETLTNERDALQERLRNLESTNQSNSTSTQSSQDLSKEVSSLNSSLEEERQKNAEAQKDIQKLKSQLKIGFDSLQAEQKHVEDLTAQVAQLKKSHNDDSISLDSNGINNNDVGYVKN
uniref:Kinectin n=1 Tax=Cacopsylla melanoneura TaxID=428564 RepID=A0A8D8S7R5_9HEMI